MTGLVALSVVMLMHEADSEASPVFLGVFSS